jgi:hypothetical protein
MVFIGSSNYRSFSGQQQGITAELAASMNGGG